MNTALDLPSDPYQLALSELDPAIPLLFQKQYHLDYFKRLRDEDPVHFVEGGDFGPYWSVTRYQDIVFVDSHHELFSSYPSIGIGEPETDFEPPMFIAMDPPKHDQQRKVVQPAVAPQRLQEMEALIRRRVVEVLDELPLGERFNWVDRVSIELTTRMLATLFDFPFEERRKLTYWSDVATSGPNVGGDRSEEERTAIMMECLAYFNELWQQRADQPGGTDFISLLAHDPATRNMEPMEYLGNLMLLIVGGNDTTRNTMSGSVLALDRYPDEFAKLKANHDLIPSMVSEVIRWQTPLAHMRRVATEDVELGGKLISKGQRVVMWYVSGNRDETAIERPDEFIIDRANPRKHLSFGFGIHRCMGNRLAELQLRILWEEILRRFARIEVVGEPERVHSNFVMGYSGLPVVLHPVS
ncbi:cytochrome P450 [Seongchinamella sediminis]|uniref:Cytochrome P450 n=1 Tax=Seongchinamella sediminis TaxID=2283635 RepID=A0A3L7E180_9GAMM|nr:cytochrome P450 [Seongchinamella sediminis]RLQ23286.1 cytochrome P450 [Seongchinamella sediminis]